MIKLITSIAILVFSVGQGKVFCQKDSFFIKNLSASVDILLAKNTDKQTVKKMGAIGTYYLQGHFSKPFETKPVSVEDCYKIDVKKQMLEYSSKAVFNGNNFVKEIKTSGDSISTLDYGEDTPKWSKDVGSYFVNACLLQPQLAFSLANQNRNSLDIHVNPVTKESILTFSDLTNKRIALFLSADNILKKAEYLTYDPLLGDILNRYEYLKISANENEVIVTQNGVKIYDLKISVAERISNEVQNVSIRELKVDSLSNNKYLLKFLDTNNKVLVTTDKSSIYIFEAPANLSNKVIKWCEQKFPTKSIKMVIPSHHHPDHAGGIRDYSLSAIPILVPNIMEAYYKQVLTSTHLLGDGKIIESPKFITVPFFPYKLQTENEDILLFDAPDNDHSDDYILSWFPKDKILFVGDLTLFYLSDERSFKSKRARAVLDVIEKNKLDVRYIYTSWPIDGQKNFGTLEQLRNISD